MKVLKNFNRDEYCEEHHNAKLQFIDDKKYDVAIIGVTTMGNVVYSSALIIEAISHKYVGLSWSNTLEHYEKTIYSKYDGSNGSPIIVNLDFNGVSVC